MSEPNPSVPRTSAAAEPLPGNEFDDAHVERVVRRGPAGALAVAGIATFLVLVMYLAFYWFAYFPRGTVR